MLADAHSQSATADPIEAILDSLADSGDPLIAQWASALAESGESADRRA